MSDAQGWGAATYGDRWAEIYDDHAAIQAQDTGAMVSLLADLAGDGDVLELAIGTGRIALPLAQLGVTVRGIDASQAMVNRLRAKPGSDTVDVTIGDMTDVPVDGRFRVIALVFNTLFALRTQDEQVRLFHNVADHLDDGVFVIECFVPDLSRFVDGQTVRTTRIDPDHVELDVSTHDAARQHITSMHLRFESGWTDQRPVLLRYAFPSELDLMARLAGLRLRDRWADARRTPFGNGSRSHVSVYARDR